MKSYHLAEELPKSRVFDDKDLQYRFFNRTVTEDMIDVIINKIDPTEL